MILMILAFYRWQKNYHDDHICYIILGWFSEVLSRWFASHSRIQRMQITNGIWGYPIFRPTQISMKRNNGYDSHLLISIKPITSTSHEHPQIFSFSASRAKKVGSRSRRCNSSPNTMRRWCTTQPHDITSDHDFLPWFSRIKTGELIPWVVGQPRGCWWFVLVN